MLGNRSLKIFGQIHYENETSSNPNLFKKYSVQRNLVGNLIGMVD